MGNGTLPAMAGNPPADAAQPSGMNGMVVTVPMNDAQEPRAARTASRLCQNPRNKSRANDHSDTLNIHLATRTPNTGYIQGISEPLLMYAICTRTSYSDHSRYANHN